MGARHIGSVGIVCCVPVIMVASQVDGWHLCETCTRHRLANSARLNCRAKTSNTVIRFPRASEAVSHSKIPFARRVAGAHRRHTAGSAGRRAGDDARQACKAGGQSKWAGCVPCFILLHLNTHRYSIRTMARRHGSAASESRPSFTLMKRVPP